MKESEVKYRQLFDSMRDAYASVDMDGNIQDANTSFTEMVGYTLKELQKLSYNNLTPEKWHQLELEIIEKQVMIVGYSDIYEKEYIHKNGSIFPVELHTFLLKDNRGKSTGMWAIVRDISERKKAEMERERLQSLLSQSQKMESIGTLAGGIAHDFNNILSPIIMHAEMAIDDLKSNPSLQLSMKEIYAAALRARDLVKQILIFARKGSESRIVLKTSPVIKEAIKFLRSTIPTSIDIQYHNSADQDTILADPTQLNQIVMNLCTNAAHAMREKGGLLEVTLHNEDISIEKENVLPGLKSGRYLKLSVKDNGTGISPEIIDRVFEPYYTSKKVGEGTGLGLATVHGIAKNYGGDVTVESRVGQGTVFHVYIPVTDVELNNTYEDKADIPKGNERILLVDDEKGVVGVTKKMLEKIGYKVTARTGSIEALELFRNSPEMFDLVITDMTMPDMTGERLAGEIMAIKSRIPVILCTGFSDKIDRRKAIEIGISAFVLKPIVVREMADAIRKVLDENTADQ